MIVDIGQSGKETFNLVNTGSSQSLAIEGCDLTVYNCQFKHVVLANSSGNEFENDKSSILGMFPTWTTSVVFVIQKLQGASWVDKHTVTDNTYGDYYPQGYWTNKPKYAGFVINWANVLAQWSTGLYRIKSTEVNPLNPSGVVKYSLEYCLKEFGCSTPENTVRIEWWNNRKIGSISNDREVLDFSDINWYNQYRLPLSIFGYPTSEYEVEENQYPNGEYEHVKIIQKETYILKLGEMPSYLHDILKTYALMSGTLQITDYSSNNPAQILSKAVKLKSGYEPRWSPSGKCAPVTLELEPRFNNLETFRC